MSHEAEQLLQDVASLQESLLLWFETYQRNFPWRSTSDPYVILVAEKLLQQTAARESVVEAFQKIMERYPSPETLAHANLADLEAIIEPLGFRYRAQELLSLGQAILDRHAGEVPNELRQLMSLPGVGEYIARAVLSFAYRQDIPVVDTNVARFLYRVFGIQDPLPSNPARKQSLLRLAAKLVPVGRSREFNLAILDLCSLICTSRNPQCSICPIQPYCLYGSRRTL